MQIYTSKERVICALEHKKADRVLIINNPSWLWFDSDVEKENQYALFRKEINLPQTMGELWKNRQQSRFM